jgi:hypothetical protein
VQSQRDDERRKYAEDLAACDRLHPSPCSTSGKRTHAR